MNLILSLCKISCGSLAFCVCSSLKPQTRRHIQAMLFKSKFTLLFLAVSAIPASAVAESSNNQIAADEYRAAAVGVLPTVEVRGKRADKPFRTPSAVSHRDADELGQDANTLIRTMPGTFTQHDLGQANADRKSVV